MKQVLHNMISVLSNKAICFKRASTFAAVLPSDLQIFVLTTGLFVIHNVCLCFFVVYHMCKSSYCDVLSLEVIQKV